MSHSVLSFLLANVCGIHTSATIQLVLVLIIHVACGSSYSTACTTVREIPKSSCTFFATNISSNIVWFHQLHDTIQMKSNYIWINYNHDNIAIRSHIMIYNFVRNLFLLPNLVTFISHKEKNVWFFDYHLLTCSVRKMVLLCLMQNIDMRLL